MDKLLKPSETKTVLEKLSEKRSSDAQHDVWLGRLMEETRVRYPNQALTPDTSEAYLDDWTALVKKYGPKSFVRGLEAVRLESEFFPSVAAIKKAIETLPEEQAPISYWNGFDPQLVKEIAAFEETPEAEEQRKKWKETVAKVAGMCRKEQSA